MRVFLFGSQSFLFGSCLLAPIWYAGIMDNKPKSKRLPRRHVIAIRKQYSIGYSISELALSYGFSSKAISDCVHHRTHKRVQDVPHEPPPPPPRKQRTPEQMDRKAVRMATKRYGH